MRGACLYASGMNEIEYPKLTDLKDRLVWARKKANFSQGQLAKRVGMSTPAISRLENGHDKKTAFATQLAAACGVDPVWLATGRHPRSGTHVTQLHFANDYQSDNNHPLEIKKWSELSSGLIMSEKFLFSIDSDLMQGTAGPSIPQGSTITVDPSAKIKPGCIYMAHHGSGYVVGTFSPVSGNNFLRPSNNQYPAAMIELSDIIGMVVSYTAELPQ